MLHLLAIQSGYNQAETHCLTSRPLPGFLISETDYPHVAPLLEEIFATDLGSKSVEEFLNGR
jgi:hypothetical protein